MTKQRITEIQRAGNFRVVEDHWQTLNGWDSSGYRVEGPWIDNAKLNKPFPAGPEGLQAALACMREEAAKHRA